MATIAKPPFVLYVIWHPHYAQGAEIGARLQGHFGSDSFRQVAGGAGVRVIFRNEPAPGAPSPSPIEWDTADATAAVTLLDRNLGNDDAWVQYVRSLADEAETKKFHARVFPVMMDQDVQIGFKEQALRWDRWVDENREQRLVRELTDGFSRMLRHRLTQLQEQDDEANLKHYMQAVKVFLSHSKHDDHGERVAHSLRAWFHEHSALSSFMDVYDIPPGLSWMSVIEESIKDSVFVIIYTDSYSSREWCRREVIEAKRRNVPIVMVDCLQTGDVRVFPYLGNVPVVRMAPEQVERIEQIVGLLLNEVFKDFLWRCRMERMRPHYPDVLFMARTPELITLAGLPYLDGDSRRSIVYPDPPLSEEEAQLFTDIGHKVRLHSVTEWLKESEA